MQQQQNESVNQVRVLTPPSCDSPLPAWKHYRLLHQVDMEIREELTKAEDEYLVGLEVAYCLIDHVEEDVEVEYISMSFGELDFDAPHEGSVLGEEFLDALFEKIFAFIDANLPKNQSMTGVWMSLMTRNSEGDGTTVLLATECLKIGSLYQKLPVRCNHTNHHSGNRWCRRNWAGTAWNCTGDACVKGVM